MGSFNTFCGISHQVIRPDEPCVIIPITRNSSWKEIKITTRDGRDLNLRGASNSTCHANAFWTPISIPLRGTYADYGEFELYNDEDNLNYLEEFLFSMNERSPVVHAGDNEYHDYPLNVQSEYLSHDKTFESAIRIFDAIWAAADEHRAFYLNSNTDYVPLQFMAIHQTTWDEMVSYTEQSKTWDGRPYDRRTRLDRIINDETKTGFDTLLWYHLRNDFLEMSGEGLHLPLASNKILKYFGIEGPKFNSDEFLSEHKHFIDTRSAYMCMNSFGFQFAPMVYADQDYSNEIGNRTAKFIDKISTMITTSYRDDDDIG